MGKAGKVKSASQFPAAFGGLVDGGELCAADVESGGKMRWRAWMMLQGLAGLGADPRGVPLGVSVRSLQGCFPKDRRPPMKKIQRAADYLVRFGLAEWTGDAAESRKDDPIRATPTGVGFVRQYAAPEVAEAAGRCHCEYRHITDVPRAEIADRLNVLAGKGWRVVSTGGFYTKDDLDPPGVSYWAILERPRVV